ncbi:putative lipoprotein [Idiomarina aquatica]|uniref:Putative lipoprotein n=1 Tax=Idiomarina aquatica TaxID=1327752 RepID=A0A4R6NZE9_9GAMM|nr:YajG family lipoprotein [Idiomarina aquatica]TDP29933.1 putative lipoprotein [Idiomarina aquatica]
MIGSVKARLSSTLLIALTSVLLSACASAPQPLIINLNPVTNKLSQSVQQITVNDQRSHSYLYRQLKSEDKARFTAPSVPLKATIEGSLQTLVKPTTNGNLQWIITIEEAVVKGTSSALKYQLKHEIELRVTAINNNRRYSNVYRGRAESSAIGRADEAVIEREFSALLARVLTDISNDPKLRIRDNE